MIKQIFLIANGCIFTKISLKFVPSSLIDNKSALVHAMACRRTGDKPLPEPMMIHFTDAYVVTRSQWVKHANTTTTRHYCQYCWRNYRPTIISGYLPYTCWQLRYLYSRFSIQLRPLSDLPTCGFRLQVSHFDAIPMETLKKHRWINLIYVDKHWLFNLPISGSFWTSGWRQERWLFRTLQCQLPSACDTDGRSQT